MKTGGGWLHKEVSFELSFEASSQGGGIEGREIKHIAGRGVSIPKSSTLETQSENWYISGISMVGVEADRRVSRRQDIKALSGKNGELSGIGNR